jgi:hypothetical protein
MPIFPDRATSQPEFTLQERGKMKLIAGRPMGRKSLILKGLASAMRCPRQGFIENLFTPSPE